MRKLLLRSSLLLAILSACSGPEQSPEHEPDLASTNQEADSPGVSPPLTPEKRESITGSSDSSVFETEKPDTLKTLLQDTGRKSVRIEHHSNDDATLDSIKRAKTNAKRRKTN